MTTISPCNFDPFREKMSAAAVSEAAILSFEHSYRALCSKETGLIGEDAILAVDDIPRLDKITRENESFDPLLLEQTVVVKLNGGLGTSMGLQKAKSLLPIRGEKTFLDLIVHQIRYLHDTTGSAVRFLLMNSFSTSKDTMSYLSRYAKDGFQKSDNVEMMQNRVPKIDARTLLPVEWAVQPDLEWCPPGHGDIYAALSGSGWLDRLLQDGVKYAFISNSDNLGAVLHPALLRYFAEHELPFLMEVTERTEADKKGGHLALRRSDRQMLLREVAQCPEADLVHFQNIEKHRYFNTNSLWINLEALKALLERMGGLMPLPMIKNLKTVDPRDASSPEVYQLETAMGAAIECFPGASAVCVPRVRFAPVKTTNDLFSLRSDAYCQSEDGHISLNCERKGIPPVVSLDPKHYKLVDGIDLLGSPSLVGCKKLEIQGKVSFEDDVILQGEISIINESTDCKKVLSGKYADQQLVL